MNFNNSDKRKMRIARHNIGYTELFDAIQQAWAEARKCKPDARYSLEIREIPPISNCFSGPMTEEEEREYIPALTYGEAIDARRKRESNGPQEPEYSEDVGCAEMPRAPVMREAV